MPSKQTVELAQDFANYLTALENTRARMEGLLNAGNLSIDDIEQVYIGLYLNAFTAFEGLLEDLFFGLLCGNLVATSPGIKLLVSVNPPNASRDILLIGKDYFDWIPYDNTIKRAAVFFEQGLPFTCLNGGDQSKIKHFHLIRNAIAHKSEFSKRQFQEKVIGSLTLTPRERQPGSYLRSTPRSKVSQNQYQIAVEELKAIANKLCG